MKGEGRHVTQCPVILYIAWRKATGGKVTMRLRHKMVMRHGFVQAMTADQQDGDRRKWEQNDGLELLLEVSLSINVCVCAPVLRRESACVRDRGEKRLEKSWLVHTCVCMCV